MGNFFKNYKTTLAGVGVAVFGYLAHANGVPYGPLWTALATACTGLMGVLAADSSQTGK